MNNVTIIRTIVLAVALINQALVLAGYSPLPYEDAEVEAGVTIVFTTAATIWAWWKNNSITKDAQLADELLRELKASGRE